MAYIKSKNTREKNGIDSCSSVARKLSDLTYCITNKYLRHEDLEQAWTIQRLWENNSQCSKVCCYLKEYTHGLCYLHKMIDNRGDDGDQSETIPKGTPRHNFKKAE